MVNPFKKLAPGDKLPHLPHEAWNAFLDLLEQARSSGLAGRAETPVEVLVRNDTGAALPPFSVVGLGAPLATPARNPDEFKARRQVAGVRPTADGPFAVVSDGLPAGAIGKATVLGLTPCKVDVTAAAHKFAGPTTDPAGLTSGGTGPARIVWVDPAGSGSGSGSGSGTGVRWAVVLLGGAGGGDRIEIGEPAAGGPPPPHVLLEYRRVLEPDLNTMTLNPGEFGWFWDVNGELV